MMPFNAMRLRRAAAGASDPYFANVVSLLHFDGSNGSTTITDQISGKTWTAAGATIATAQSKFGGASLRCGGSSEYVSSDDHTDWQFGSDDFTLEGWVYFDSVGSDYDGVISRPFSNSIASFLVMRVGGTTDLAFWAADSFTTFGIASAVTMGTVAATTWHHWAVSRVGTSIYLFVDGTLGNTITTSAALHNASAPLYYGTYLAANHWLAGYADECRITKGVGRYTANFTPPTTAFPNS